MSAVEVVLDRLEPGHRARSQRMKNLQLVNRYWPLWATRETQEALIAPQSGVPLGQLIDMISQQFVNQRTLHLLEGTLLTELHYGSCGTCQA